MTALYIILGIIAVIIILLFFPITVCLYYDGDFKVNLRYLFLNFRIFPQKQNAEKPEKNISKKKNKADKKNKKSENDNRNTNDSQKKNSKNPILKYKDQHGWEGLIQLLGAIVKIIVDVLKKAALHLNISKLDINLIVVGDDAADSAVKFGYVCSVVFPLVSVIENNVGKCVHKEDITPGFLLEKTKAELDFKASIKPFFLLGILISAGIKFIKSIAKK